MTSDTGQQIIAKHILPNTSGSKRTYAVRFGQLIEYNMRNITHTQNVVEKLVPDLF